MAQTLTSGWDETPGHNSHMTGGGARNWPAVEAEVPRKAFWHTYRHTRQSCCSLGMLKISSRQVRRSASPNHLFTSQHEQPHFYSHRAVGRGPARTWSLSQLCNSRASRKRAGTTGPRRRKGWSSQWRDQGQKSGMSPGERWRAGRSDARQAAGWFSWDRRRRARQKECCADTRLTGGTSSAMASTGPRQMINRNAPIIAERSAHTQGIGHGSDGCESDAIPGGYLVPTPAMGD